MSRATRAKLEPSNLGAAILGTVVLASAVFWWVARPAHQPFGRYLGEFLGVEAVLLFSCTLVLATLLTPIEKAFGGLDRVAVWHRRTAVVAVIVMLVHPSLAGTTPVENASQAFKSLGSLAMIGLVALAVWSLAPSLRTAKWSRLIRWLGTISHERWLTGHRLTGLFVAAAVVHGALLDPVLKVSPPLKIMYLTIGGIGIAAYIYREVFARFVVPIYDYKVSEVKRPNEHTLDVFLEPVGPALKFAPGQFVFLTFGGVDGWQRHPFSVASAPTDALLEVSIRAVGDYTNKLYDKLQPGTPAVAAGPFGGFDYRKGGQQQVWIAGGMGITPFMSWLRSLEADFNRDVVFSYSVASVEDALFTDEIASLTAAHPTVRTHIVDSSQDGYLTAERAMQGLPDGAEPWVYMCGPPAMMKAMAAGFGTLGVPKARIRWEEFNVR